MSGTLKLDGEVVAFNTGETIWDVARRNGTEIPHLCHTPGLTPAGNCRACMVEVDGERTLAASCCRAATDGMTIRTASARAQTARRMVLELLLSDAGERTDELTPHSELTRWATHAGVTHSRLPARAAVAADTSHPAMAVNLDACIQCTRCLRACRDEQVNDVIGLAGRGAQAKIVFDADAMMGESSCVACGECVQACPTGALMPAAGAGKRAIRREVNSVCPYCGVGCQLTYHVGADEAGAERIEFVTGRDGPANHGRLCVKGRYGFDYVQHGERLTVPLIRRDGVAKDAADIERVKRGELPLTSLFREASWDEALDFAAAGLRAIRDGIEPLPPGGRGVGERGAAASAAAVDVTLSPVAPLGDKLVAASPHKGEGKPSALAGFGSAKGSNEEAYLFQKLVRQGFRSNNVDHCTRLCHASSVAALLEGIGSGSVSNPVEDVAHSDLIFLIGANPSSNHPVAASWIKNAVKRGARLLLADPRQTPLARFAEWHLQFRPDTDVALLNGMLHVILFEGLTDPDFIAARVNGFEALKAAVAEATPERMAEICGIDAATIRAVARAYATSKASMILWGMGISQHVHGTDNARCLIALAMTTGQIGRAGTGLHPLRGQNNVQGASDAGLIPMMLPNYQRVTNASAREHFEALWGVRIADKPGLTVVEVMNAIHAGTIRGMYIEGENPAMSDPDLGHARAALAKLSHLVVQDIFPTETAILADVILPASAHAEKWGSYTNTDRLIQIGQPALEPPGSSRQDLWAIEQIGRRMGLDWNYWRVEDSDGHLAAEAPVARVYEEMRTVMAPLTGVPWARLRRDEAVVTPALQEDAPGDAVVFVDHFPTADGRATLVPTHFQTGVEQATDAYPFVLATGRILQHWHGGAMTRRASTLEALAPAALFNMHPDDAARSGLHDGDVVRVTSHHGEISARLAVEASVQRGQLFIPFAYWEAAANKLTGHALDPFGKIPGFKVTAVRVTRALEGAPFT